MSEIITVCLVGLILGSFASALAWRIPRGKSWITARSRCPSCDAVLAPRDLVPLLSWLFARGKCRHCGKAIGWRYPLIELAVLAGCLGVYAVWGPTVTAGIVMATIPFLVASAAIDIESMILPDSLTLIAAVLGAVFILWSGWSSGFSEGWQTAAGLSVLGAAVFPLAVWLAGWVTSRVLKKEALGFGDVKFFAMAGLWLGLPYLPIFLFFSGFTGLVWGLIFRAFHKAVFPFGPALIFSFYICLFIQELGPDLYLLFPFSRLN